MMLDSLTPDPQVERSKFHAKPVTDLL
jgi:hypothetical protein